MYDLDDNGVLDYDEIAKYLKEVAYPDLKLSYSQTRSIFNKIDKDGSNSIDKNEMA